MIKRILLSISLLGLIACTPSAPYEVKSPCVSIENHEDTQGITPCVRRPANANYAIT